MSDSALPSSVPLSYSIARATPHSGNYVPENVILDKPQDKFSRWSGALEGTNTKQWILLRLDVPAILKTITFGKFNKTHPCNMKEFKVYVGLTEDNMSEILHSALKNDTIQETFPLRYLNSADVCFPTRYIKVVPISAHGGHKFHVSIWHVSMTGISDPAFVQTILNVYEEHRETAALKHILKHLRQRRLLTPFNSILSRTSLHFEHPLVTKLYTTLVLRGDWEHAESLLQELSSTGLFSSHLSSSQPYAVWHRLVGTDADGDFHAPKARGGHAMCIDPENENIYVFGGWDGERSLDDFWMYSIKDERWTLLSASTRNENNAPGPRSCHKMAFDTKTGSIYLLGRLSDFDGRQAVAAASRRGRGPDDDDAATPTTGRGHFSEFYRYHTRGLDRGKWDFLSFDTASSGGPPLVFDHQMVMDCDAQILYVSGGRVIDGDQNMNRFSGLYCYNVRTSKWKSLQPADSSGSSQVTIPPRYGHSMVLDPKSKTLFIFAGQSDRYLSDMYAYDIPTNTVVELFSDFSKAGGPEPSFTQRAVIDPDLKEIFIFCGLTNGPALRSYSNNWIYRYHTRPGQWVQILREPEHTSSTRTQHPRPRFAHQVVYNPKTRCVYMHGGNAGGIGIVDNHDARSPDGDAPTDADGNAGVAGNRQERRLDDFWRMEMRRPGPDEVIRKSTFHIRRQQFREMCEEESLAKTLKFLQTEVAQVVDHTNASEEDTFRSLLTHLLARPPTRAESPTASGDTSESGSWTSKLSNAEVSSPSTPVENVNVNALCSRADPYELQYSGGKPPPSADHYAQRMEVFEALLEYISDNDKEPSGSLLDIVEREGIDKKKLDD